MGIFNNLEQTLTKASENFIYHVSFKLFGELGLFPTEEDQKTLLAFCQYMIESTYDVKTSNIVIDNLTGRNEYVHDYRIKYDNELNEKYKMFDFFTKRAIEQYGAGCIDSILKMFSVAIVKDTILPDDNDECLTKISIAVAMYHESILKKKMVDYEYLTKLYLENTNK